MASRAFADVAQQVRQDHRRHEAATHFGIAKARLRHRHGQIAHGNQSRAAGDRRPVDGNDGRLGQRVNQVVQRRQPQGVIPDGTFAADR